VVIGIRTCTDKLVERVFFSAGSALIQEMKKKRGSAEFFLPFAFNYVDGDFMLYQKRPPCGRSSGLPTPQDIVIGYRVVKPGLGRGEIFDGTHVGGSMACQSAFAAK
jgi:hypothetical protein